MDCRRPQDHEMIDQTSLESVLVTRRRLEALVASGMDTTPTPVRRPTRRDQVDGATCADGGANDGVNDDGKNEDVVNVRCPGRDDAPLLDGGVVLLAALLVMVLALTCTFAMVYPALQHRRSTQAAPAAGSADQTSARMDKARDQATQQPEPHTRPDSTSLTSDSASEAIRVAWPLAKLLNRQCPAGGSSPDGPQCSVPVQPCQCACHCHCH